MHERSHGMRFNRDLLIPSGMVLFGLAVSLSSLLWLRHHEEEAAREKFTQLLDKYTAAIQSRLHDNLHPLDNLAAYYFGAESVTREEFDRYAHILLKPNADIQALEWVPEVPKAKKSRYEAQARANGYPGFFIRERNEKGEMVPAEAREKYYPIFYLYPSAGNEKALGFDLGSEPLRKTALLDSKKKGTMIITAPIDLVQDSKPKPGMLIVHPVYADMLNQKNFKGYYTAAVYVDEVIKKALAQVAPSCEGVNLRIIDTDAADNAAVYESRSPCGMAEVAGIRYEKSIEFAGRRWKIEATPSEQFTSHYLTWYPEIIFSLIWILTGFIAWVHYLIARRYRILEETNDELRRFQAVAIGREDRIIELKTKVKNLEARMGGENVG